MSKQFHTLQPASPNDKLYRDNNKNVLGMDKDEIRQRPIRRIGIVLCGGNVDLDKPMPWMTNKQ